MDAVAEIGELLVQNESTIAVAESVTAGRLQAKLSSLSGASGYFSGGVTAYNIDQKVELLGVDREHAASINCVSAEVAKQMLSGVLKLFSADFGIATTGYAEPSAAENVTNTFAFVAIGSVDKILVQQVDTSEQNSRAAAQALVTEFAITQALELLRKH